MGQELFYLVASIVLTFTTLQLRYRSFELTKNIKELAKEIEDLKRALKVNVPPSAGTSKGRE